MKDLESNEIKPITDILVVGLGGIGSNLVDLVVPALERCKINANLSIMDDDIVEHSNLGHQRYSKNEVGQSKAKCLANRHSKLEFINVTALDEALRHSKQLKEYDVIIVAVDRPEPRELVHQTDIDWLDLRCQGDGWIIIDSSTDSKIIDHLPQSKKPTSCQMPGALEDGNIEFGFAAVAVIGAQWLFQKMRLINGANTQLPGFRMGYLTHGEINPKFTGVVIND